MNMRPVRDDEPLMIAWKKYKETDEFKNSEKWAQYVTHPHIGGSLWAVFEAGFLAGQAVNAGRVNTSKRRRASTVRS